MHATMHVMQVFDMRPCGAVLSYAHACCAIRGSQARQSGGACDERGGTLPWRVFRVDPLGYACAVLTSATLLGSRLRKALLFVAAGSATRGVTSAGCNLVKGRLGVDSATWETQPHVMG